MAGGPCPEDTPTPIAAMSYSSSQQVESLLRHVPAFHTLGTLQSCVPRPQGAGARPRVSTSCSACALVPGRVLAHLHPCITRGVCIPPMPETSSWRKRHCARTCRASVGLPASIWKLHKRACGASLPPSFLARQEKAFPVWMVTANGPGILNAAVCSGTGAARA